MDPLFNLLVGDVIISDADKLALNVPIYGDDSFRVR